MGLDFNPNKITNENCIPLRIEAVDSEIGKVVCKYPPSFMNELARQITLEIENSLGIEGIAQSSVELIMAFASNTYLEHISENVTYRRLQLLDAVSAPRDFWVKWTRLAADIEEYSSENIRFELGEDVDQKIREREYRYLLVSGKDGYHNSMGRKKVTEWREVIKRAVKRGEISKLEKDFELAPETLELEARIADLLGKKISPAEEPVKEEINYTHSDESEFELALARMRQVVEGSEQIEEIQNEELVVESEEVEEFDFLEEEPVVEEEQNEDVEFIIEDELDEEILEEELDEEELDDEEIVVEIEEISDEELASNEFVINDESIIEDQPDDEEDEVVLEEESEVELNEEFDEEHDEKSVEELEEESKEEPEVVAEPKVEATKTIATPIADRAADIRAEIETKIRLEYESRARAKAEEELISLRREYQKLKLESEALLAEARKELEILRIEYERLIEETALDALKRENDEAQRRAEEEELRAQIEAQLRQEARERERLAEAARMAIEEQHRLEAENARIARQREEEERAEAEARRREEEERELEALRQSELERIRREDEEAKAKARAAMPEMGDGRYSYTSKSVKLVFRRSVDPNITTRIHEIIKATVEYYGKDRVYLKIKAIVPDSQTVVLEFEHIPLEEMALLGNIIKILGNSGLGIAKAIIE